MTLRYCAELCKNVERHLKVQSSVKRFYIAFAIKKVSFCGALFKRILAWERDISKRYFSTYHIVNIRVWKYVFTSVVIKIKIFHSCRTRAVHVAFVSHLCRSCSTLLALVSHSCHSCLTHVALVLLVSHSCCNLVALVSLVSVTRVVN